MKAVLVPYFDTDARINRLAFSDVLENKQVPHLKL